MRILIDGQVHFDLPYQLGDLVMWVDGQIHRVLGTQLRSPKRKDRDGLLVWISDIGHPLIASDLDWAQQPYEISLLDSQMAA